MKKKYIVELTSEERSELQAMVKKGKATASILFGTRIAVRFMGENYPKTFF